MSLTGGNRNDVTQLLPLVDKIPKVKPHPPRRGRPRQRPVRLYADRGYDHDRYRRAVRDRHITPVFARRANNGGTGHGSGLGIHRYVVEQTSRCCTGSAAYAPGGKSVTTSTTASSPVASSIICWRRLKQSF